MFRLLGGCAYRCLCVRAQLAGWRQNAAILQKQSLIVWMCCSEETWLLLFCRAESCINGAVAWKVHVNSGRARTVCSDTWGHAALTVCSHYCIPAAAERAACPGCRTWGNMSDMATCLQAWLVTLLNCCNFLLLDRSFSCVSTTFHLAIVLWSERLKAVPSYRNNNQGEL